MLLFGTKKSIKMKTFLAVIREKAIPEIAVGFNPALNNSEGLEHLRRRQAATKCSQIFIKPSSY